MLDAQQHVPVQVPPPYAPRPGARPGPGGFTVPRSPRVIALAFAVAAALGIVIGLVTAPHGGSPTTAVTPRAAVDTRAAPAIPASAWGGNRQPGATRQVRIPTGSANREALRYVYAVKYGQSVDAVTIPIGKLYYGVVLGDSAANDAFYAAGTVVVAGTEHLVVWERTGTGPWQVAHTGAGACDALPQTLFSADAWKGRPALCAGA